MKERIAVNPQIHFGKPCVAGTRIPVQSVLELVKEGFSFEVIIQDYYPDLDPEDIPREHRQLFLDAARAMILSDGEVGDVEAENLVILDQLLR